jgi:cell division protein ZapA
MERVDINILGRDYSLACPPEERDSLKSAADHVAQLAGRIQGAGKIVGNERIVVMVAIQIAVELLTTKASDGPMAGLAVGDFKRRIQDMNSIIDEALSSSIK